jgi:hypothetical protein
VANFTPKDAKTAPKNFFKKHIPPKNILSLDRFFGTLAILFNDLLSDKVNVRSCLRMSYTEGGT